MFHQHSYRVAYTILNRNESEVLHVIRLATQADFTAIDQLILKKAEEFQAKGKSQWAKYLEPSRSEFVRHDLINGTVYIYEEDETVVGSVSLIPPTSWDDDLWTESGDAVFLHRLVTDSRMRGKQIGEQLMRHALRETTGLIRLDCVADNLFLNTFYSRFGFTYVGEKNGFSLFEYEA